MGSGSSLRNYLVTEADDALNMNEDEGDGDGTLTFFAVGDWGKPSAAIRQTAASMDLWARTKAKPHFIMSLGDNFYPKGVRSVRDKKFRTVWGETFLRFPSLRVPWRVILGNHDYMGNPEAQVDYTTSSRNRGMLWQMPSRNYCFSIPLSDDDGEVAFFGIDTNGAQGHVRKSHPEAEQEMFKTREWLARSLQENASARWKIVFGHHPMYTRGFGHGREARCLRLPCYMDKTKERRGYAFEEVLQRNGVHAYFAGHEHVLQSHLHGGVSHFGCGASGADRVGFYGGEDESSNIDWFDKSHAAVGFAVIQITKKNMTVLFVDSTKNDEVVHRKVISRSSSETIESVEDC